jgi:hypothetical protein
MLARKLLLLACLVVPLSAAYLGKVTSWKQVGVNGANSRIEVLRDGSVFTPHRGRLDFVISRNAWVRTSIEMSPGTRADDVESIATECVDLRDPRVPLPPAGECTVQPLQACAKLGERFGSAANAVRGSPSSRFAPIPKEPVLTAGASTGNPAKAVTATRTARTPATQRIP